MSYTPQKDPTEQDLSVEGLLMDILKELRRLNTWTEEAMGFAVTDEDIE
jgi:hypothetical protein